MKIKFLSLLAAVTVMMSAMLVPSSVHAETTPSTNLDFRVLDATHALSEIMVSPDQSIPEELLAKCKAIAIYPNVIKGGFIIGARYGRGVVLARDEKTGAWSPLAFSTIGGGSFGLQIGGSATDLILLIMNDQGLSSLLQNNFTLGVDAQVAAGPVGRDSQASTDLFLKAGLFSYSRSRGLFAGAALDGAMMTQDNNSNTAYYGKPVTSREILLGNAVAIAPGSQELISKLEDYSARWEKRIAAKK